MTLEVQTRQGKLAGVEIVGAAASRTCAFRGIPYARPPVGALRFRAPHPPDPWQGVRPASRPGPVPIQASVPVLTFLNAGGARQSEDCLTLNVWTPGPDASRRPVLVWIHGGGFLIGAGSTPVYDGHELATQGDMVVVTLNYRLGALGFLHLDRLCPDADGEASNVGVRDQIAALEWVRDNIDAFGGDPEKVTVCGQSAGAMSIAALIAAPRARQLFRRAILQSGAGEQVLRPDEADRVAESFLSRVPGRPRTLEALSRVPIGDLLRAQGGTNRELSSLERLMCLVPCCDGELIREPPLEAVRHGALRDHELLVGTTLDEWKLFSPVDVLLGERGVVDRFRDLLPRVARRAPDAHEAMRQYREAVRSRGGDTSASSVWSSFQSTRVFHRPATQMAEAQSRAAGRAYSYLFTWQPPALSRALGACHAIELPFLFGLRGVSRNRMARPFFGVAAAASRLSSRMQRSWIAFAHHGDPGHERLPEWDVFDRTARATMLFDRHCSLADGPLQSEIGLLEAWS